MNESSPAGAQSDVLQRRAAALARPLAAIEDTGAAMRICSFTTGAQSCAVSVRWLKEARPLRDLTLLPVPAPHVMGVVNIRGHMVPVLQIGGLLGQPAPGAAWMLVLAGEGVEFAVAADAIGAMGPIDASRVARMENFDIPIVAGCTPDGCFILDGQALAELARKASSDLPRSPLSRQAA